MAARQGDMRNGPTLALQPRYFMYKTSTFYLKNVAWLRIFDRYRFLIGKNFQKKIFRDFFCFSSEKIAS